MVKKASQPPDAIEAQGNLNAPYSQEAEEATIGAILVDGERFEQCLKIVQPEGFFILRHRHIWEAIKTLYERKTPIDYLTVSQQLKDEKRLTEIGGAAYLTQLTNATPTSVHAEVYASLVERSAVRRRMLAAADDYRVLALNEEITVEEAIQQGQEKISGIKPPISRKRIASMHEIMSGLYDQFEERIESGISTMGVSTGYVRLDEILGGWREGRLHYVGGRPGMGKTALMLDCAVRVARQRKPLLDAQGKVVRQNGLIVPGKPYNVLFISMEMKKEELGERLLSNAASLSTQQILNAKLSDKQQSAMTKAFGDLHTLPLFIEDEPDISPERIKQMCLDFIVDNGSLDMVVVDYIQLMKPDYAVNAKTRNREQELSSISREMKVMSALFSTPFLVGAQLNREVEKRRNKRPVMSDFRDSGSLEQDGDVVLFPYFPAYYIDKETKQGSWEVIVAKQRNGGLGTMYAWADFTHHDFRERNLDVHV